MVIIAALSVIVVLHFGAAKKTEAQGSQSDGYIVVFDNATKPENLNLEQYGVVKNYSKGKNFPYSFAVVKPQAGKRSPLELSRAQGIKWTEPNYIVHLDTVPNDPMFTGGQQWYLGSGATDMEKAWPTTTSETIGIIDTGCANHVDLPIIPASDRFETLGGAVVNGGADDLYGHGTWSTGIIEALSNNFVGITGIIWNPSRFVCIKAFNDSGGGSWADLILAIQLAQDQGVKFLNAPWGESFDSQLFSASVQYYLSSGDSYLIASCGNDTTQSCNYPANYSTSMEGVIAIGALDKNINLASFSSYGPTLTFVEPGVDICSTVPSNTYGCHDGTSGSVPIALGIAAVTHKTDPLQRSAFLQFLKSNARDLGNPGFDSTFGWGMLTGQTVITASTQKKIFLPIIIR